MSDLEEKLRVQNPVVSKNVVLQTTPLRIILQTLANLNTKIVFLVDEDARLVGSISDGDIRRWLLGQKDSDLSAPAKSAMNPKPQLIREGTPFALRDHLLQKYKMVPLVNQAGLVVDLLENGAERIQIGSVTIGPGDPCFIIAEIGVNHNGSIQIAKQLIDAAMEAGAQAVKFQKRNLNQLYGPNFRECMHKMDLSTQHVLSNLIKCELPNESYAELFEYSRNTGIVPLCTPWDLTSVMDLEQLGVLAYKVASADLTNHELLLKIVNTKKPIIISTGMSTESEILETSEFLKANNATHCFLHSNSTYPTPESDVNLSYLERLKNITGVVTGYSGHERGINISIAAVALGASIIERHITLDKNGIGPDHKASLEPTEFAEMVTGIRQVEMALGTVEARKISQGELLNRENLSKSIFASKPLKVGHRLQKSDCTIRSPGSGIPPNKLTTVIGKILKRPVNRDEPIYWSDFDPAEEKRKYVFPLKYGIPVRFHDAEQLLERCEVDLVEFHLSYDDLLLNPRNFLGSYTNLDLIVHAPELFSGDHIIDLASKDEEYRKRSITLLRSVIDMTIDLHKHFPNSKTPRIIINAGGWNRNSFIVDIEEKQLAYELIGLAMKQLESDEVILLIQTMPPFPWHLGGQSYHSLFVNPEEIKEFCSIWNSLICFDSSHSRLACEYYGLEFNKFVNSIKDYIDHAHLSDAKGFAEEGLEIGLGDINFQQLLDQLINCPRKPSFIPEIWQGHKEQGKKFWESLERLESMCSKNSA